MKTDLKTIDNMIASITKRGKALRNDCHSCLVAILEHHIEHGDYTRLPKLLEAVKGSLGSSLSAAMIDWTARFYTGLAFDQEDKEFKHVKGKGEIRDVTAEDRVRIKGADENQYFIGNARDLPFYELEREVKQQPFDLTAAIVQLVKRAEAALEANVTKHAHNHVNRSQVEVLKNLAKNIGEVKEEDMTPTPQQVAANDTNPSANKPSPKTRKVAKAA